MKSQEIRQAFINYFQGRNHRFVRSAPVVPIDDPTLLFTNAGMNQFKPIFLGEETRAYNRAVNSQKCIRVSGKHNDLEEVGVDTFHHTFFEMLGNWSFGDYYKAEAIQWAWELFTEVWGLDKQRLWATVFETDDEAFELWAKVTDIDPDRILRCGAKDNFWEMGETGPCGPCSEIHYFIGDDPSQQAPAGVNVSDQYWELWNLVFIQSERQPDGSLIDLPAKHVDTGAGLERITAVLQGKTSNYQTDLFQPIIRHTAELAGIDYRENPIPFRVIADHIRMLSFSIADGAMPANDGRGYVLRRILRRAARFGRMLNLNEPFIYQLVDTVGQIMGEDFPEVVEKAKHIKNVIRAEETSFNETLDRGLNNFDKVVSRLSGKTISGEDAFRLYDTYGFPLDLTQLLAREKGLSVDEEEFERQMSAQRQRAKAAGKFRSDSGEVQWNIVSEEPDSEFLGYEHEQAEAHIRRWAKADNRYLIILDRTPFYAESGGQLGDEGTIAGDGIDLQVNNTWKDNERFVHECRGKFDSASAANMLTATINNNRRNAIRRNHTATHLMHAALKQVLGDHVHQAGSLVAPDHFRFDLTHFEKISSEQLSEVERIVNSEILKNTVLAVEHKTFDEARSAGAEALFGEKYGDEVRVITIGDFSMELCGGTHVQRTGDIGLFKITEEAALAAGVRRIIAVTGITALEVIQEQDGILNEIREQSNAPLKELTGRIKQLIDDRKRLEKELKRQQQARRQSGMGKLVAAAETVGDHQLVVEQVEAASNDELKAQGDSLLARLKSGVGVLGAVLGEKPGAVVVVTADLIMKGIKAGDLAREIGKSMGAGGGGKPHLATAGGRDPEKLATALKQARITLHNKLTDGQ